jgi:serine/threonine-protein kinase
VSTAYASRLAPGARFGNYFIVRQIGSGAMGVVYEATHALLKKRVALKTLQPIHASIPESRARFVREGESAARICHPNVIDVTDVGTEGDVPFLVMEFLEGEDLAALLKREGPLSLERIASLLLPVLAAVETAHRNGVVHRDLKPQNIFLAKTPAGAIQPKVVDFGMSKILSDINAANLTATGEYLGTPYYMSPEHIKGGKHVTPSSDQYSLGSCSTSAARQGCPIQRPSLYSSCFSTSRRARSLRRGFTAPTCREHWRRRSFARRRSFPKCVSTRWPA